jgi:ATP-dependent DNA helicase RecQ
MDEDTTELLARLRKLRKALADARGMPAYIVFNDATLHQMAQQRPRSPGELLDIAGVGPKKLEQYGLAFLAEIAATQDSAMLPGDGGGRP